MMKMTSDTSAEGADSPNPPRPTRPSHSEEERKVLQHNFRAFFTRGVTSGLLVYGALRSLASLKSANAVTKYLSKSPRTIRVCSWLASIIGIKSYSNTATRNLLSLEDTEASKKYRESLHAVGFTDEMIDRKYKLKPKLELQGDTGGSGIDRPSKLEFRIDDDASYSKKSTLSGVRSWSEEKATSLDDQYRGNSGNYDGTSQDFGKTGVRKNKYGDDIS